MERSRWIARHVLPVEPALRAWLSRQTLIGIEPDDVIQETYSVLGALASVDHIRVPRHYVFTVARSIVLAQVRRSKIVSIEPINAIEDLAIADDRPSPEHQAIGRQELRFLAACLAMLPIRQREAFSLLKIEGLSQREAAQRMGIAESTIEKHVAKALLFLTDRLGRGGNDAPYVSSVEGITPRDEDAELKRHR